MEVVTMPRIRSLQHKQTQQIYRIEESEMDKLQEEDVDEKLMVG